MPTTKVTRNYQITIPSEVRSKVDLVAGDLVLVEYDEENEIIKVRPPRQKTRKTRILGRKLSIESIHKTIEKGMAECQKR